MTNTQKFAQQELDILAATVPDAIVTPFAKEILALCEAFGNSGQSGGSAPYTASAISQAVKKLLLQEPICDVTGHENEWVDVSEMGGGSIMYQNSRCSALFKDGIETKYKCINNCPTVPICNLNHDCEVEIGENEQNCPLDCTS